MEIFGVGGDFVSKINGLLIDLKILEYEGRDGIRRGAGEQLSRRPQWSNPTLNVLLLTALLFYFSTASFFAPRKIGATGFEPAAFWSQTRRSAKLSYAPALVT